MLLEIATTDYYTTELAVSGGADRIELCAALSEGGTTPSYGVMKRCREKFSLPIFPMIRPRSGDFFYNNDEVQVMKEEIRACRRLGFEGVVFGILKEDGSINLKQTAQLVDLAYPMEVTFHRAFDRCRQPFEGLEQLIEAGVSRLLSSGQQKTALEGIELLKELVAAAGNRIIIMPGSGVRKETIQQLAAVTGANEFHTSLRTNAKSKMNYMHPAFADSEESYRNPSLDIESIQEIKKMLQQFSS